MLLRSLLFYMGLISSTMFIVPFCLLISPLPFPKRYYFVTRWTAFNLWWLKITCDLTHSIEGLENIPANTSIIFCEVSRETTVFTRGEIFSVSRPVPHPKSNTSHPSMFATSVKEWKAFSEYSITSRLASQSAANSSQVSFKVSIPKIFQAPWN